MTATILRLPNQWKPKKSNRRRTTEAVEAMAIDNEIMKSIRSMQLCHESALLTMDNPDATLLVKMDARLRLMESRQRVSNLILAGLIHATESGEPTDMGDYYKKFLKTA